MVVARCLRIPHNSASEALLVRLSSNFESKQSDISHGCRPSEELKRRFPWEKATFVMVQGSQSDVSHGAKATFFMVQGKQSDIFHRGKPTSGDTRMPGEI
jgi:hypothetical protein